MLSKGLRFALAAPGKAFRLAQRTLKPVVPVEVQGSTMYMDRRQKYIVPYLLRDGCFEPHVTEVFKRLIKPGMTVVDIGANIGYYTLLSGRLVGPQGRVYAFEPEPEYFRLLLRNIQANGYENITAVDSALSSASGSATLFTDKTLGNPSLSEANLIRKKGRVQVRTVTLDQYLEEHLSGDVPVDFIKMDVQGAEGLVVSGAERTLARTGVVEMEFWPEGLRNLGTDPMALMQTMLQHGFRMHLIEEVPGNCPEIEPARVLQMCEERESRFVDLLFTR